MLAEPAVAAEAAAAAVDPGDGAAGAKSHDLTAGRRKAFVSTRPAAMAGLMGTSARRALTGMRPAQRYGSGRVKI